MSGQCYNDVDCQFDEDGHCVVCCECKECINRLIETTEGCVYVNGKCEMCRCIDQSCLKYENEDEEEKCECDCCGEVKLGGQSCGLNWTGVSHYRFCEPCKPRMEEILMNALRAISKMTDEEKEKLKK